MKLDYSKPSTAAVLVMLAAGLLLFLGSFSGEGESEMTHVGGTMNHCTCTQRLER